MSTIQSSAVSQLTTFAGPVDFLIDAAHRTHERLLIDLPGWLVDGSKRFYWVYLLSFVVLGVFAYRRYYRDSPGGARHILRFLFPPETYRHPSALLDYQLFLANRILGPSALLSRLLLGSLSITYVATATHQHVLGWFGGSHVAAAWSWPTLGFFVLSLALVQDFSTYVVHFLHHRIPLLWEFHKVHHTAEVLTPVTVYRKHPLYNLFGNLTDIVLVGPFQGLIAFLFIGSPEPVTLFGANLVFSLFHLFGANLRHSHIWLPFSPAVSRILISPAQHQIHHSKADRHSNRNFGEVFAIWDWLFNTLYVPTREREILEFGVAGATAQEHATLLQAYLTPFTNCGRILRAQLRRPITARGHLWGAARGRE